MRNAPGKKDKRGHLMEAETKLVWLDICAEAGICEDPDRLAELKQEIDRLLLEEEFRLRSGNYTKLRA
jgi:hypothetical protein